MTEESLKHGLTMKLMPGQLLSSKHLAVCWKVDHWEEQQLATASSHADSGFFVMLASTCRLLLMLLLMLLLLLLLLLMLLPLLLLLLMLLLLLIVSIRGRPIVNVNRMLKIDKTLTLRNCIVSDLNGKYSWLRSLSWAQIVTGGEIAFRVYLKGLSGGRFAQALSIPRL